MHLSSPVAGAAAPSQVVVLLLLIYRLMYFSFLWGFCVCLCFFVHCFVLFLYLQASWICTWVGMQCVMVVFPDHTHLFFYSKNKIKTLWIRTCLTCISQNLKMFKFYTKLENLETESWSINWNWLRKSSDWIQKGTTIWQTKDILLLFWSGHVDYSAYRNSVNNAFFF